MATPPTAVPPQTLGASAAQPAEERYQPNVTIQDTNHSPHWLLKSPANIIRNTANQSPTTPAHNHPAISLAVRAHNSSCQRHPACARLSNRTSEQARHDAGDEVASRPSSARLHRHRIDDDRKPAAQQLLAKSACRIAASRGTIFHRLVGESSRHGLSNGPCGDQFGSAGAELRPNRSAHCGAFDSDGC